MGNVAILTVSTDVLSEIKDNPRFGTEVAHAACEWRWPEHHRQQHSYGVRILNVAHSTSAQLVWSQSYDGGPVEWQFTNFAVPPDVERRLVETVKALGYRVVTPRTKKRGGSS